MVLIAFGVIISMKHEPEIHLSEYFLMGKAMD
jgi:hypothetical protein